MATIRDFPKNLLDEHKGWHHSRHLVDFQNPPIGYGLEFLDFHRDYIGRAMAWYAQRDNDPRLVEPWDAVPEQIRRSPCYNVQAEARILYQPQSFASADELGRFIESSGLHGCIHQEAAKLYGEPDINDFDVAPRNTVFYNIHRMIDRWYQQWEGIGRFARGMSYWCGMFDQNSNETLYYRPDDGLWWLGKDRAGTIGLRPDLAAQSYASSLSWSIAGDSSACGAMRDDRAFGVYDADGDGKLEVVVQTESRDGWQIGKIKDGRLQWQLYRL